MNNFSIQAIYSWYRNAIRNPKYRWWIILGTLVYLLSPIDVIPDVIPIIGEIDDFVIVSVLVAELSQLFLERFKPRQGDDASNTNFNAADAASKSTANPTTKATVDVDAVSTQ